MDMLLALWLPIVVATFAVFFASFLAWTVLGHHNADYRRWPDEDRLLAFVRQSGAEAGEYIFPLIEPAQRNQTDGQARYAAGPWGMVSIWPAQPNMARNLVMTALSIFVITCLIAYVGAAALPSGAGFGIVFQVIGTTAILAHTAGAVCREIWFTRPLRAKLMDFLDGLAYGVVTGIVFGLMWP